MFFRKLSLRWQMLLVIVLAPLLLLLPVFAFVGVRYNAAYHEAQLGKAQLVAEQLGRTVTGITPYVTSPYDVRGLDLQVRAFAEGESDLAFAALVLDGGEVVFHSVFGLNGRIFPELADLGAGGVFRRDLPGYGSVYLTALQIETTLGNGRAIYAVVGQLETEVNPPVTILTPVLAGLIVLALLVALMQLFVNRVLLRPLAQLAEDTAIVGAGDLNHVVAMPRDDEIGILSRSFEQMTGQLRMMVQRLEQQVTDRTLALQRKSDQFRAANLVAREAAYAQDVPTLLETTVMAISEYFGFYHAGIFLLDEIREWAVLRAASSEGGRHMLTRRHRLRVASEGIVGAVASTGLPRIALDVGVDAAWFNNPDLPNTRSEIGLPLKTGERVIGVLDVQSEAPDAFSPEDIENLQLLADQVALALQNAQLLEQMQGAVGELEALQQDYRQEGWARLLARQRPLAYEYDRVQVYPTPPLPTPPDFLSGAAHQRMSHDAGSEIFMEAMRAHGQVIGLMALTDPDRVWTQEERALVESVGEQVGLALENARLFEDAQRTARQQSLINFVLQVAATTMEPSEALREIARVLAQGLRMAVGVFTFPDPEIAMAQLQSFLSPGGDNILPPGSFYPLAPDLHIFLRGLTDPTLGRMLQTSQNEVLGSTYDLERILYVPIRTATIQKGVLAMAQHRDDPPLDPETRELARNLAGQIAVILENISLLEETQQRSAELQSLYEISLRFSTELDTGEILRMMVDESASLFDVRLSGYFRYIAAENRLVLDAGTAPLSPFLDYEIAAESEIGQQLLHARRPVALEGQALWGDHQQELPPDATRLVLAVPVLGRATNVGVLAIWGDAQKLAFDERDIRLSELFITQVVAALENARLYEASTTALGVVEKQARYQTNVAQSVALLAGQRGVESVPEVLRLLGEAAQVSRVFYFETLPSEKVPVWNLVVEWVANSEDEVMLIPERLQRLPVERFPMWKEDLIQAGITLGHVDKVGLRERRILRALGVTSFLGLAVPGPWEVPGILGFVEVDEVREWTDQEIAALQTAAAALSNTLARERLFAQVQEALAETEVLYEAGSALNVADTFERILDVMRTYTILGEGANNVTVQLFERPWTEDNPPEWLNILVRWTSLPLQLLQTRYPLVGFISKELFALDQLIIVEDMSGDSRITDTMRELFAQRLGIKSTVFVPLVASGQWIGYLNALYPEYTTFPEAEQRRLSNLAAQAAVAIQNLLQLQESAARARRERQIREVVGQIQAAPDVQSVLQTAVRELGRVLGAPRSFVQLLRREGPVKKPGTGELAATATAAIVGEDET